MANRSAVPKRTEKAIFQQFSSRCPFCGERNISTLQLHHIEPYAEVKSHDFGNLILVCANCHSRIEAGDIPKAAVYRKKNQASLSKSNEDKSSANSIILENADNSGVIANQLTILNRGQSPVMVAAPSGTIASRRDARNYVKYLIDRYHDFKRAEIGAADMKHSVFYNSIKRKFGAKWDFVPLERFEDLVESIQMRIDKTVLGKNRKAKGNANYNTFEEYLDKHGA